VKQKLLFTFGIIALGMVAFAAGPAAPQTISAGPYYATPSWDQTLACATLSTCPRFIVLSNMNNEAVLDRETGLVWQQNPATHGNTWQAAHHDLDFGCIVKTTGGRSGWRVPRLEELQSLTTGPLTDLPASHPFGPNATGTFWSATTDAFSSSRGRLWVIGTVGSNLAEDKGNLHKTWCVRSPTPGFVGQ
jgi:hypothetical protein